MSPAIRNRYDFVYFFDVTDGNPNGDPDASNMPRVDSETNQGLVTDVCLKRKVRNYVADKFGMVPPHDIYVREGSILNEQHAKAYIAIGEKTESKKLPAEKSKAKELTAWMCKNFFDIRTFGAVMTFEVNCGQVRGPVQFTFARSVDPIVSVESAITSSAVANARDAGKGRSMGRKFTVPYGLYRCHGFINAPLAERTQFGDDDLAVLKEALNMMFESDRSAARGMMAPVRCIAFKHDARMGNARADELFAMVSAKLRPEAKTEERPPRSVQDYVFTVPDSVPKGISIEDWVPVRTSSARGPTRSDFSIDLKQA